ncbi:MAG: 4-hydroxythreonine-4-phosphate dehydrogenase PdxA, partial [Gammaproteobacteria bacterium]|nr:4-hydroxythreonine-4-phosphate dehydrogenase PdxA [Gammaproteobacteria bacterium]
MNEQSSIVITPGEPAGIGPELVIQLLQKPLPWSVTAIADPALLLQRAATIGLPAEAANGGIVGPGGYVGVYPVKLNAPCLPGRLDPANAEYVMETLELAIDGCLAGDYAAMVTGPVQKSVIRQAGFIFSGHTEFLAQRSGASTPVMMLVNNHMRVALVTIHLPLAEVPAALTKDRLTRVLRVVDQDLRDRFGVTNPRIGVCGLNPHAGESGYLGLEEINVIEPVIGELCSEGLNLVGPLPADTIFVERQLLTLDLVVAMYHDQGLPVVKHKGFGKVVNVTLGLP